MKDVPARQGPSGNIVRAAADTSNNYNKVAIKLSKSQQERDNTVQVGSSACT